nr:hypothetical protein [Tanacetum cinerariifolium]
NIAALLWLNIFLKPTFPTTLSMIEVDGTVYEFSIKGSSEVVMEEIRSLLGSKVLQVLATKVGMLDPLDGFEIKKGDGISYVAYLMGRMTYIREKMQRSFGQKNGSMMAFSSMKALLHLLHLMILAENPNMSCANVSAGSDNYGAKGSISMATPINDDNIPFTKPPIKLTKTLDILGASIAFKEELIGLVDKLESGALDDVIFGLTTTEREAAHALVIELARGFDYVNSDSDTSNDVIYGLTTSEREAAHALVLELARGFDYVNSDNDTSSEEPIRITSGV